jgi:HEAT repeat protein
VNHRVDYAQEIAAMTTPPDNTPGLGGQHTNDVKLGGDSALLHLINSLDHSDPNVRSRAALMLAGRGDSRAYETLVRVFEEEPQFRQAAIRAFGKLGDARATECLSAALFDTTQSRRLRIAAAQALGSLSNPQAVEALLQFIENHYRDQNVSVPITVINALVDLREPRAIQSLHMVLMEANFPTADYHFDNGYWPQADTLSVALLKALRTLQGPMVLFADLLSGLAHRGDMAAIRIVRLLQDAEAVPELLALLHLMIQLRRESIARAILRALRELRDQQILDSTLELLSGTTIIDHRLMDDILRIISSYNNEKAIEPVLGLLPKYPFAVTQTLFRIGGERAIEALRALLIHENAYIRSETQSALNHIGTLTAMTLIAESLNEGTNGSR